MGAIQKPQYLKLWLDLGIYIHTGNLKITSPVFYTNWGIWKERGGMEGWRGVEGRGGMEGVQLAL